MKIPEVTTIDFETRPIFSRPDYPPKPVGFSIQFPGERKSQYYGWGHPVRNNCSFKDAQRLLKTAWKGGNLLFHNDKFDVDVAEEHMGCPRITDSLLMHDTMFLLALSDPHAMNLQLKASAERILGLAPKERDDVARWLVEHQHELKADGLLPIEEKVLTMSNAGKWICLAPGDLVGTYAEGDVLRTYKLFRKLWPEIVARGMLPAYQREQKLMPILLDNEREGMKCNLRALESETKVYEAALLKADDWLRKKLKTPDLNIDSDAELAQALDNAGIVTEWTLTKTGKRSTSKKNMKVDTFTDKNVASVLGYRGKLSTCLGTFMRPWLRTARRTNGIIHTNWNQVRQSSAGKGGSVGARTLRMSSSPNFQNIPTDLEDKNDGYVHPSGRIIQLPQLPLLRKLILPDSPKDWFGRRDYNQQELRILAHFEDGALLQAYLDNPNLDTHNFVKSVIEQLLNTTVARSPVKTLNFGYIYGQGVPSMAEKLQLPVADIKRLRDAQLKALPGLKDLSNNIKARAGAGEPIRTWGGREYYCEEPAYSKKFERVVSFEYKLLNYLIQGSAADVTKEAIIRYHEHPKKEGRMVVQVHDELDISAPKGVFKEEMLRLREVMESIEMDVLMISDGEYGPNWGSLTDLKEKR
jgi:DNA polymerase-1